MITFVVASRNAHKAVEIRAVLGPGARCFSLADLVLLKHREPEKEPSCPPSDAEPDFKSTCGPRTEMQVREARTTLDAMLDIVEDEPTFAGNALKKARAVASWLVSDRNMHCLGGAVYVMADDSGLEVDALHGEPGVRSARYASATGSGNSPDGLNNAKLLTELAKLTEGARSARFRCSIAIVPLGSSDGISALEHGGDGALVFEGTCEGRIALTPRGAGGFGYDPLFIPSGWEISFAELGEDVKNRISHRARALGFVKKHFGLNQ